VVLHLMKPVLDAAEQNKLSSAAAFLGGGTVENTWWTDTHICVAAVFSLLSGQVKQQDLDPNGGRPRGNRKGKRAIHAHPEEGDKGIAAQTRGNKRPKARLVFPVDTKRRPRPALKSPHGDP